MDYVGEWHTHPECNPTPSTIDMRGWTQASSTRKAPMLFVIVGTKNSFWIGFSTGNGDCVQIFV